MKALKYLTVSTIVLVAGVASAQLEWHTAEGGNEDWFQDQGIAFRDADAHSYLALSAVCQSLKGYLNGHVSYAEPHFCESRKNGDYTEWKCGSRASGYCNIPYQ